MNRLLIIDGHNLHFQIFFGIQSRLKKAPGKVSPFGIGFTGAMKRIIRFAKPTHVVVIFDGEHENPRRALYPAYKANRPDYSLLPDDENPYLQLPAVRAALDRMKIKYVETTTVEADDLIAICCERFKAAAEIVVCSHDHDFYQLLGNRVKLMNYSGKQGSYYDEKNFRDEFHISPRRYADYKALNGDKSDNIPGVRGVGAISVVRLLNRFGGVEGIIEHTGEVRQKKLRRCLIEGADRMRLNYKLVKLGGEQYESVELPWKLADLAYTAPEEPQKTVRPRRQRRPNKQNPEQKQTSMTQKPTTVKQKPEAPAKPPKPIEQQPEPRQNQTRPEQQPEPRQNQTRPEQKPEQRQNQTRPEPKPEQRQNQTRPEPKPEQRKSTPRSQPRKDKRSRPRNKPKPQSEPAANRILTRKEAWND